MKILIVYYSLYGHVLKLAQAVKEGAESVKGAEVLYRRVEEFDVVLKKTADDKYLSQVREQQKELPEDRASYSQSRRTLPLLGHWDGEWPRSRQKYALDQLASGTSGRLQGGRVRSDVHALRLV